MKVLKKYPIYRKFIANNFVSTLGDSMYYIALMTYAAQFTNSGLAISMVSLSEAIPGLFFIVTGSIADLSHNKVKKNLANGLIRGILYFIVGVVIGFQPSLMLLAGICVLNFISDILGKYSSGLMAPFILYMVNREDLEEAQGLSGAITSLVGLLAQFVGAYLMGLFSYQLLAWINSGTFFLGVIILFSIKTALETIEKEKLVATNTEKPSINAILQQMVSAIKDIKECRPVFSVIILFALSNGALSVLIPLISMLFSQNPHLVIQNFSFTLAFCQGMISFGVIVGSLFGPKVLSAVSLKTLCLGMFISTVGLSLVMLSQHVWLLLSLLLVLGLLIGAASPKLNVLLISHFPIAKLGTIGGGVNSLLLLTPPLATVLFTSTATALNLKAGIILLFIFSVASLIFGLFQPSEKTITKPIKHTS